MNRQLKKLIKITIILLIIITNFSVLYAKKSIYNEQKIAEYQKAISQNPKDVRLYLKLGQLYAWDNKNHVAKKAYSRALELAPKKARIAHIGLSKIYIIQKKYPEAISELRKYLAYNPHNMKYKKMLAEVYFANGDFNLAETEYEFLYQRHPYDYEILIGKGKLITAKALYSPSRLSYREKINAYKEALIYYQKANQISPFLYKAKEEIAALYFYSGLNNYFQTYLERNLKNKEIKKIKANSPILYKAYLSILFKRIVSLLFFFFLIMLTIYSFLIIRKQKPLFTLGRVVLLWFFILVLSQLAYILVGSS